MHTRRWMIGSIVDNMGGVGHAGVDMGHIAEAGRATRPTSESATDPGRSRRTWDMAKDEGIEHAPNNL